MISPSKRKNVYNLTDIAQIRFKSDSLHKPVTTIKFEEVKGWTNKLLQIAKQKIFKNSINTTTLVTSPKAIKGEVVDLTHLALLNSQLLLVGNSFKLDLIHIQVHKQFKELDISLVSEIFTTFPVKTITIERKKQFVIFNGDREIELFALDSKSHNLLKKFTYYCEDKIQGIQLIGDNCLLQYHDTYLNVLGLQNWQPQIIKKMSYQSSPSLKVFRIPSASQNYGNVFLYHEQQYDKTDEEDAVNVYTCQIVYENSQFKMSRVQKIYQVEKKRIQNLVIYNYDINTVLFNFGAKLIILRNHYPIDQIKINYGDLHSKLYFLQNRNILHVCDTMVENYSFQVYSDRVDIKCFDCINFIKPRYSLLLGTPSLIDDKFMLVFKLENKQNTKQTKYWITQTIQASYKQKLQSIFKRANNNKHEVYQSAIKMGMSRNQVFYQLWMQSARKNKQDFDILLQSQDYKTITDGVWNVLKKQSISFKQLVRIQKQCLKILEVQIRTPTQTNLVQYLKCSFNLRKYRVQKRLETDKKKRKDNEGQPQKPLQIQFSIQQYQDIRKRNIKNYLLQLMKKCDDHSIIVMRHIVDIFRLTFRHIFPKFMIEIIEQLKQNLLQLLIAYPQLLPLPKNQPSTDPKIKVIYYGSSHGVWADILKQQWQDNIYFQNLKNIQNVDILQSLMTKDYFKWDWLVEHDFFKVKREEFESNFKNYRQKKIFYIFFSELFVKLSNEQIINKIIALVESKYIIPQHLVGKTKLYWQLHNFFQKTIPKYKLSFENFLGLQQDQIYNIIFSNNKKGLVLKQIKSIYNSSCQSQVYDESILKYFKADYSSLADLKYLLNRVNSQKSEFHSLNQNLYSILVQAAHYKLKWTDIQQPPISQIMVYYENIPLGENQIEKLNRINMVQNHLKLLEKIGLKMNLRQLFDNGVEILNNIAFYLIKDEAPDKLEFQTDDQNKQSFETILDRLLNVRDDLYLTKRIEDGEQFNNYQQGLDNQKVLELLVSNCLDYDDFVQDVKQILKDSRLLERFHRPNFQSFLQKIITQKVSEAFTVQSDFTSHKKYINGMIELLDQSSKVRKQLHAHLELGLLLSVLSNPPQAPLIISIRFIQKILQQQSTQTVKKLDIQTIYNHMQKMGIQQPITSLYEVLIHKYLIDGQWKQAIKFTRLWNRQNDSISFSATVMLRLAEQLPRDLRRLMIDIVIIKLNDAQSILDLATLIIDTPQSKQRRKLIQSQVQKGLINSQQNYEQNFLIIPEFKQLSYPNNSEYIKQLFDQIMKIDVELQNNYIYYMFFRILMCNPLKGAQFLIKNFDYIDIKVLKTFILEVSKKQYDQKNLTTSRELYLFVYKCLLVCYCSNYLSKQFNFQTLLRLSPQEIENRYSTILDELKTAMFSYDEKEKFMIFRYFKKLYTKIQRDNTSSKNFNFNISDEEDNETVERRVSTTSQGKHPFKTKKSIFQIVPVSDNFNQYTSKNNNTNKIPKNQTLMSKSLRQSYKPPSQTQIPDLHTLKTQNKSVFQWKGSPTQHSPSNHKSQDDGNLLNSEHDQSDDNTRRQLQFGSKKELQVENQNIIEQQSKIQKSGLGNNLQLFEESNIFKHKRDKSINKSISRDPSVLIDQVDRFSNTIPILSEVRGTARTVQQKDRANIDTLLGQKREVESQDGDDSFEDYLLQQPVNPPVNRKSLPSNIIQQIPEIDNMIRKKTSDISQSIRISYQNYPTERQFPQYDQSRLYNSQFSSLYPILDLNENKQDNIFTITIKNEQKLIDSQKVSVNINVQPRTISQIASGDYTHLFEQLKIYSNHELQFIQQCVNQVFKIVQFKDFVSIIQKLRELNNTFNSAVKAQNLKILKNACKTIVNFDLKSIFTPQVLYITSSSVDQTNEMIFRKLKPRIISIVEQQNVFMLAKTIFVCLHFNKSFQFRVQYYYLQKLFKQFLLKQTKQQIQMDLQKIEMLFSRLPVNMTIERIDKMILPIIESDKIELIKQLLNSILNALKQKSKTPQGQKYMNNIEMCQKDINLRLENLEINQ